MKKRTRNFLMIFVSLFISICMTFGAIANNKTIANNKPKVTNCGIDGCNWTATYYGNTYKTTRHTANGDVFDKNAMTCAAPKAYKFGTILKVTNINNGKTVHVRVNDRGGFGNRTVDLTHGAFGKIANHSSGRIRVHVKVMN